MKTLLKTIFFSSCLISSHLSMASFFIRPMKNTATAIITMTYLHKVISGKEKDFTKLPDLSLAEVRDYYKDVKITCNNTFESLRGNVQVGSFTSSISKLTTDEDEILKVVEERHAMMSNKQQATQPYDFSQKDHHTMSPEEVVANQKSTHTKKLPQNSTINPRSPKDFSHDPETPNQD